MSSKKLIIALDYGTTNSGAAYALLSDNSDDQVNVKVVHRWPEDEGKREATDKVPSNIAYDEETKEPVGYGYDIPDGALKLQWVKLLLEPKQFQGTQGSRKTERVWDTMRTLSTLDKQPVHVVADYLSWLWARVCEQVIGEGDRDILEKAEVTVVLTLPAQWSDRAKACLLQAAKIAGIDGNGRVIKIRAEPEAAAAWELKARAPNVSPGDCFIIVDAGGGTVDVTTYRIRKNEPLSIDQVVLSKGDFCGSEFIDAEFRLQIKSILGPDWDNLDDEAKAEIEEDFEYVIKHKYRRGQTKTYSIPVPGLPDDASRGIGRGKMKIPESVLKHSFESIMTQVMSLIEGQRRDLEAKIGSKEVEGSLKGILLVGGFGGSKYLQERIQQKLSDSEGISVWRGDHTSTAVVQGAVDCEASHYRNVHMVNTRMSSFNYGIVYRQDNVRKVQWLVRKGQAMTSRSQTEPYGLRLDDAPFLDNDKHVVLVVTLVRSATDDASDNFDESVQPHGDIECRIPTDIRSDPNTKLIQNNPKAWHIPAELMMVMDSAIPSIKCRVRGEDMGEVELSYFDDERDPKRSSFTAPPRRAVDDESKASVGNNEIAGNGVASQAPASNPGPGAPEAGPPLPVDRRKSSSAIGDPLQPTASKTWTMFMPRTKQDKPKPPKSPKPKPEHKRK